MFDTNGTMTVALRTERGAEQAKVRFPTDEEWSEWFRTRHILIAQLGRGASQYDMEDSGAAAALYQEVRQEGSPDLHPLEAKWVIDQVGKREVTEVEADGNELTVQMKVWGAEVEHRLRIPGVKEVSQFRRVSSRIVSLPFGKQQIKQKLEPGVQLYDACLVKTGGYSNGSIPAIHKDEAIRAVLTFIEEEADEGNA